MVKWNTGPHIQVPQALATAVRTKRSGSSNGSGSSIKVEPYLQHKAGLSSSISQFLAKLWRLVNDRDTDDKICWSEVGYHSVLLFVPTICAWLTQILSIFS